ncbi:MAG: SAM-dependent methyltransferase [Acidimicrobiales bacterium]
MIALHHDRRYFDERYARSPDPWHIDARWYEERKRQLTMAMLPRPRYRRGVEPGCGNGALTERLAARCDELIAFDLVAAAAARAGRRLASQRHVRVLTESFPAYWPEGTGDLVVWSEVAYYLTAPGEGAALRGLRSWLEPGGTLVTVHYTGVTDHPRPGAAVAPWLDSVPFLSRLSAMRDRDFEIGVWRRNEEGAR